MESIYLRLRLATKGVPGQPAPCERRCGRDPLVIVSAVSDRVARTGVLIPDTSSGDAGAKLACQSLAQGQHNGRRRSSGPESFRTPGGKMAQDRGGDQAGIGTGPEPQPIYPAQVIAELPLEHRDRRVR